MSPDVPTVDAREGKALVEAGALLVDVRESDEWDAGHAPGAVLIPTSEFVEHIEELPEDRQIVAICRTGARSGAVTSALTRAGYDAVNLAGGMQAWAAEGYPVVTSDGNPGTVI